MKYSAITALYMFSCDGLSSKAFTQVQKLATVYACARETLNYLFPDEISIPVAYTVIPVDVKAAFDIVKQSIDTYKSFKVRFVRRK